MALLALTICTPLWEVNASPCTMTFVPGLLGGDVVGVPDGDVGPEPKEKVPTPTA